MPQSNKKHNGHSKSIKFTDIPDRPISSNSINSINAQERNSKIGSWGSTLKSKIKSQPAQLGKNILSLPTVKSTRKRPTSFIPRRFSSSSTSTSTLSSSKSSSSFRDTSSYSAPLAPTVSPSQHTYDIVLEESIELSKHNRVSSISSSLSSEKSSLSRSLSKIRKHTKSFFLLDPPSTSSLKSIDGGCISRSSSIVRRRLQTPQAPPGAAVQFTLADDTEESLSRSPRHYATSPNSERIGSPLSAANVQGYISISPPIGNRPGYRRSVSYNDREATESHEQSSLSEKQSQSVDYELTSNIETKVPSTAPSSDINLTKVKIHPDSPLRDNNTLKSGSPQKGISRQRSKTLNALDNPLEQNANSGVLYSITNLMKMKKSASPQSPISATTPVLEVKRRDIVTFNEKDQTPGEYLDELLETYPFTTLICILSIDDSDSLKSCIREYFNRFFDFQNEPIDISLRKFLMLNELPKETQQIDRVVYEFAKHYRDQNPYIGLSIDMCYILTYSLIMLHTDRFNPNNRKKMTKIEFLDNLMATLEQNEDTLKYNELTKLITKDILGYYYDNITHSPFVNIPTEQSDEILEAMKDVNKKLPYPSGTILTNQQSQLLGGNATAPLMRKRSSTFLWTSLPTDPYQYIIDNNVSELKIDLDFDLYNPFIKASRATVLEDVKEHEVAADSSIGWIDEQVELAYNQIDLRTMNSIKTNLTGSHCMMALKIPKSKANFLTSNYKSELIDYEATKDNVTGEEFVVARIFKIGMISRQESKILSSTKSWKRYFAVLTSVGLLFYKNLSLFKMSYVTNSKSERTIVLEETTSNATSILDSFDPNFIISNGSFAIRRRRNIEIDKSINDLLDKNSASQSPSPSASSSSLSVPKIGSRTGTSTKPSSPQHKLKSFSFYIYARNSKDVYMVDNSFELNSWISTINCLSSLDSITLPFEQIDIIDETNTYKEIINLRTMSTEERLEALDHQINTAKQILQEYITVVKRLLLLAPFNLKTRESLLSSSKILNVKIEWLWFELSRNSMIRDALRTLPKDSSENVTQTETAENSTDNDKKKEEDSDCGEQSEASSDKYNEENITLQDAGETLNNDEGNDSYDTDSDSEEYASAIDFSITDTTTDPKTTIG